MKQLLEQLTTPTMGRWNNNYRRRGSQEFSLSEWDGAVEETLSQSAASSTVEVSASNRSGGSVNNSETTSSSFDDSTASSGDVVPPEMNIGAIRAQIQRKTSRDSDEDDKVAHVSSVDTSQKKHHHHGRRASFRASFSRKPSLDMTVGTESSASRTSYSSSAGTNIWTKLLGGQNGLWDGLDGKDVYDDGFDDDDDASMMGMEGPYMEKGAKYCRDNLRICGLAWWYETRHFLKTIWKHPHILVTSLVAFGVVCGVGMVAITSEKNAYIQKQMSTAEFIVSVVQLDFLCIFSCVF